MRIVSLLFCAGLAIAQTASVDSARKLIAGGSFDRAIDMLKSIVKTTPDNADAHLLLGNTLALEGHRNESIEQLLEVVRLRPDSAAAYNALGTALSRFAEMNAAREALENAVRLDPQLAEARVSLALVLAQGDDLPAALEQLDRAVAIQGGTPQAAYPHYLRAKIYSQRNEYEQAAGELGKATALRPDFAEAWLALGIARRASFDQAGALEAFKRSVALQPKNAECQRQLGMQYLGQGKPREALQHLKEAVRLNPENQSAVYNLQRALRQDGQVEQAKLVEMQLREWQSKRSRAGEKAFEATRLDNEGVSLEKSGDVRSAIEKYRQALELDPDHEGFRLNYGLALCRVGAWDQGIAEFREIIRRNPDNAEATRALYIALDRGKNASANSK